MQTPTKTVLVVQPVPSQAQLWQQALGSQGLQVIQETPQTDLLALVRIHHPDLLVVDMTTGLFNPYGLCRECRSQFPKLPLILTHHPQRPIEPSERRWAIYQGAADLISGLTKSSAIFDSIQHVIELAGWSLELDRDALSVYLEMDIAPLRPLDPKAGARPQANPPYPEMAPVQDAPPPPARNSGVSAAKVVMYRGRPVSLSNE